MRYKAVISYDGTNYVGWQKQHNGLSVQEVLEDAMSKTFNTYTKVTASGRTDAGVHALGQVVHFDAETSIPVDKIPYAVNTSLPRDISVLSVEKVSDDFNARFDAKKKTYCYKMYLSHHVLPLLEKTHHHVMVKLDLNKMKEACKIIEGTHDFKCFEASGSVVKNTVRTIYSLQIDSAPIMGAKMYEKDGLVYDCELSITVTGNGFLYNMVRIIAGTLLYVGNGKLSVDDVKNIIDKKDRTLAGKTLPAEGLFLVNVEY